MLAHAVKALAESNLGIGNVLREVVAGSHETNRILAGIFDQNAEILSQMEKINGRQADSEKNIRVIESVQRAHGQHIKRLEVQAGVPAAEQLSGLTASAR